jgi:hypothetical protein
MKMLGALTLSVVPIAVAEVIIMFARLSLGNAWELLDDLVVV